MDDETLAALEIAYSVIEDSIIEFQLNYDDVQLELEHRVNLSWLGIKGLSGGTADIIIRCFEDGVLTELKLIDYKHGVGVSIDADDNPQLMIYGLGIIGQNADPDMRVHMEIVQPRDFKNSNPVRSSHMTAQDLYVWAEDKLRPAAEKTLWDEPAFGPTFKRCQFCDASAVCPKLNRDALKISELGEDAKHLTKEERTYFFERADNIRLYLRKLEALVVAEVLDGEKYPGLKVVRKVTRRRWQASAINDGSDIHEILGDTMFKPRQPIGLGDMEKALAANVGRQDAKLMMSESTWKPIGDLTVALLSDRRKAVEVESSASDDFKHITSEPDD